MKMRPYALLILSLLLSMSTMSAWAQQAETIRISNDPVFLQVRADGVSMRLKIINGEMARISTARGTVGLTPRIAGEGVELHLFEILNSGGTGERMRETARLPLVVGIVERVTSMPFDVEAEVLDTSALPPLPLGWSSQLSGTCAPAAPTTGAEINPLAPCSRCCVTCDGVTACACEVWQPCGHCCCDSAACGACLGAGR